MIHGPRQLTLFPVFATAIKNCPKCLNDFTDFTTYGRAHLCPTCKKPATPRPGWKELKSLLGKPLSRRETQIAGMVADGKYNKEIAWECKLTEGTVKVYITQIYAKTGMRSRVPFVRWWLDHNKLVA